MSQARTGTWVAVVGCCGWEIVGLGFEALRLAMQAAEGRRKAHPEDDSCTSNIRIVSFGGCLACQILVHATKVFVIQPFEPMLAV
eukprot:5103132-Amphidinium_carterae.2